MDVFLPILKEVILEIQASQQLDTAGKKALALSTITKMMSVSSLSDNEKQLINLVLPLLVNDVEVIEHEAKSCFAFLKKRL